MFQGRNLSSILAFSCSLLLLAPSFAASKRRMINKCPPKGSKILMQSSKWLVLLDDSPYYSEKSYYYFACSIFLNKQKPVFLYLGGDSLSDDYSDTRYSYWLSNFQIQGDLLSALINIREYEYFNDYDSYTSESLFSYDLSKHKKSNLRDLVTTSVDGYGDGFISNVISTDGASAWLEQIKDGSPISLIVFDGNSEKHVVAYGDLDSKLQLSGRTVTYEEYIGGVKTTKTYELKPLKPAEKDLSCPNQGSTLVAQSNQFAIFNKVITDIDSTFGNAEKHSETHVCTKGAKQKTVKLTEASKPTGYYFNGNYLAFIAGNVERLYVKKIINNKPLKLNDVSDKYIYNYGYDQQLVAVVVANDGALALIRRISNKKLAVIVYDGKYKRHIISKGNNIENELKLNGGTLTYYKNINGQKKAFTYKMKKLKSKKK